jgi:hypothetical protein
MLERIEAYVERFGLGLGQVLDGPDGSVLRFERDLVWNPPDRAWATLTGGATVAVGAAPPGPATTELVPAGPVTAVDSPNVLEYEWLHDGSPAGRVRWEITADPLAGTRLVLTQTMPSRLSDLGDTVLPAWQSRVERLFAALFGEAAGQGTAAREKGA